MIVIKQNIIVLIKRIVKMRTKTNKMKKLIVLKQWITIISKTNNKYYIAIFILLFSNDHPAMCKKGFTTIKAVTNSSHSLNIFHI